eukprot:6537119-Pyramimonas_sp.AAC.1
MTQTHHSSIRLTYHSDSLITQTHSSLRLTRICTHTFTTLTQVHSSDDSHTLMLRMSQAILRLQHS